VCVKYETDEMSNKLQLKLYCINAFLRKWSDLQNDKSNKIGSNFEKLLSTSSAIDTCM
jgi:hypothetical protein